MIWRYKRKGRIMSCLRFCIIYFRNSVLLHARFPPMAVIEHHHCPYVTYMYVRPVLYMRPTLFKNCFFFLLHWPQRVLLFNTSTFLVIFDCGLHNPSTSALTGLTLVFVDKQHFQKTVKVVTKSVRGNRGWL